MSRRIMAVLVGAVGFVAVLLLAFFLNYQGSWLTGFSGIPGIQNAIADEAEEILVAGDVRGFELEVLGRDVTIDPPGDVPGAVIAELQGISGVGDVRFERIGEFDGLDAVQRAGDDGDTADDADGTDGDDADGTDGDDESASGDGADADADEPTAEPEPTSTTAPTATPVPLGGKVEAAYEAGAVAIAGQVHTEVGRAALVQAAERLAGGGDFVEEIEVTDGPGSDADQIATTAAILRRLDEWFVQASLSLDGEDLSVTGEVLTDEAAERAEQVIRQLADRIGLQVTFDVTVVETPAEDGDTDDGDAGSSGDVAAVVAALDLSGVVFEPGTPVLDEAAFAVLDDVAARLADLPGVAVEVQGHTGIDGDPDVNLLLSDDRARAVRDYLISQGVDPDRLTARGYGASQPLDGTTDGQADNERIELAVVEEDN